MQYKKDINKSFVYLLPMYNDLRGVGENIVSCYIADNKRPELKGKVFIRYCSENMKDGKYIKILNSFIEHHEFYSFYRVDKHTIMFVFNIPEKYENDYQLFLNSKYSKFSESYKQTILKFHALPKTSKIYRILYKDPAFKKEMEEKIGCKIPEDVEISSCWEEQNEFFNNQQFVVEEEFEVA